MKTRWKVLIMVGVFMVLSCIVFFLTMHIQPENQLAAYKKLLVHQGERFEVNEVLPPAVPAESNGVELAEAAFKSFVTDMEEITNLPTMMRMVAPGKALVGWRQPYWLASEPAETNTWEDAVAAVEADQMATDLLKRAAAFPAIDFHLDYKKNFELVMPHLRPLKHSAQRLAAAAMCALHNHDPATAMTNICTLLSLAQAGQNERIIGSQQLRSAMATIAMNATWEMLQATNLADWQLDALQRSWRALDFFKGAEGALLMERAWQDKSIILMRNDPSEYVRLMGGGSSGGSTWSFRSSGDLLEDIQHIGRSGWEAGKDYYGLTMWRNFWSFGDEQRLLQKTQIQLEALREAQTNPVYGPIFQKADAQLTSLRIVKIDDLTQWKWMFSESYFGYGNSWRSISPETAKHLTETAISLKRFQLKFAKLPASLTELAPEFLPLPPLDPMDGKLMRYKANPDGTFLLYSIGMDGKDDGGDGTPALSSVHSMALWNWLRGRDWVWPQPATAEEIKGYYDELAAKAARKAAEEQAAAAAAGEPVVVPPPLPAGTN